MKDEPVFPSEQPFDRGITLRDWFAGHALAGLTSDENLSVENMASIAYKAADAMIKERRKKITT